MSKKIVDASLNSFLSVHPKDCCSQCAQGYQEVCTNHKAWEFLSHVLDFLDVHKQVSAGMGFP